MGIGGVIVLFATTFIHELGHLFFAYLVGYKDLKMTIGIGNKFIQIKNIKIFSWFFFPKGEVQFRVGTNESKFARLLFYMGGIIFQLISLWFVNSIKADLNYPYWIGYFNACSWLGIIFVLLPMKFGTYKSDGYQAYHLFLKKESL